MTYFWFTVDNDGEAELGGSSQDLAFARMWAEKAAKRAAGTGSRVELRSMDDDLDGKELARRFEEDWDDVCSSSDECVKWHDGTLCLDDTGKQLYVRRYRFSGETKLVDGILVHRIEAMLEIQEWSLYIEPGELGGWVQSVDNLPQNDSSWVADDAVVMEGASVENSAVVFDRAVIRGNALIDGGARVYDDVEISGDVRVRGIVRGKAKLTGNTYVCDDQEITG